ncbi:MAG: hypothetical protein U0350_09490 [Caldilineaceae bacterium]
MGDQRRTVCRILNGLRYFPGISAQIAVERGGVGALAENAADCTRIGAGVGKVDVAAIDKDLLVETNLPDVQLLEKEVH